MGSAGHKYFNPKPEKISPNVSYFKKTACTCSLCITLRDACHIPWTWPDSPYDVLYHSFTKHHHLSSRDSLVSPHQLLKISSQFFTKQNKQTNKKFLKSANPRVLPATSYTVFIDLLKTLSLLHMEIKVSVSDKEQTLVWKYCFSTKSNINF